VKSAPAGRVSYRVLFGTAPLAGVEAFQWGPFAAVLILRRVIYSRCLIVVSAALLRPKPSSSAVNVVPNS
jgi:hypothetical protein